MEENKNRLPQKNSKILNMFSTFINTLISIYNLVVEKISKKKISNKEVEDNFNIGIDDVQNAYEKMPKKITMIAAIITIVILIILTIIIVKQDEYKVKEARKKIVPNEKPSDAIEIEITEQAWKHFQSKKIEKIASKNQENLQNFEQENKKNNQEFQKNIKKELNSTMSSVKDYIKSLEDKINKLENNVEKKIKTQGEIVDSKISKIINTPAPINNTPTLTNDMTMLPPPLNTLSVDKPKSIEKIDKPKDDVVYISPDSSEYDFSNIEIDTQNTATTNITTFIYEEANKTKKETKVEKLHLMKGLSNATLLTGVNALTFGGGGDKNPAPILLSIDGSSIIANYDEQNIENCFVSGVATGNVNTAKADVLITEISCSGYTDNGERFKIEENIKGWVIGEDGSFGLDGRLIDSSGKVITKMIALEVLQSITAAMVVNQNNGILGLNDTTNQDINPQYIASQSRNSLASGVNKGLDHAYEHYSEILSGMYPTISVRAGKKVSILFKGGEDLNLDVYDSIDISKEYEVRKGVIKK